MRETIRMSSKFVKLVNKVETPFYSVRIPYKTLSKDKDISNYQFTLKPEDASQTKLYNAPAASTTYDIAIYTDYTYYLKARKLKEGITVKLDANGKVCNDASDFKPVSMTISGEDLINALRASQQNYLDWKSAHSNGDTNEQGREA